MNDKTRLRLLDRVFESISLLNGWWCEYGSMIIPSSAKPGGQSSPRACLACTPSGLRKSKQFLDLEDGGVNMKVQALLKEVAVMINDQDPNLRIESSFVVQLWKHVNSCYCKTDRCGSPSMAEARSELTCLEHHHDQEGEIEQFLD